MCNNGTMYDNQESHIQKPTSVRRSFLGAGLAIVLAASAFFSGVQVGNGSIPHASMQAGLFSFLSSKPAAADQVDMSQFWAVWKLLDEKFVTSTSSDSISVQDRVNGAIKGLVHSYDDPYTVFLPPSDANMFSEDIAGNFGGVGMEVGVHDDLITVIAPLLDSPAAKAGIVAKDVIAKIDGKDTQGMSIEEAVGLIRGEIGSVVTLSIYREGETALLEIPVTRGQITVPTTDTKKVGDVFVISLYSFNAISEDKMQEALQAYEKSGLSKLIIDLRGNPGGYLQSAVSIASNFLPAGKTVVSENFGNGQPSQVYRSSGKLLNILPKEMLVLVDGGSASASEILAGALQEDGVAKLLGAQTYGKGSVQELIDLNAGASLKVTVARWYTPNGISISKAGLTPDILVDRTPQQVVAGEDPQLDAAVKWLDGDKTVGTTTQKTTAH